MPDLKQSLRDFVATSNSGKYKSEDELLSKFPELKSYDRKALRDFVATSNSGKYKSEDEILSKFPEFGVPKKKVATELQSGQPKASSLSATQKTAEQKPSASSGSANNVFSGYPGQQGAEYKIVNGVWQKKSYGKNDFAPIENDNSVKALNSFFKQKGKKAEKNTSVPSSSGDNLFSGYPGKENKKYKLQNGMWYEHSATYERGNGEKEYFYEKPIVDAKRVGALNKVFKQNAGTSEYEQTFTGYPGQEGAEYRIRNGNWEKKQYNNDKFVPINNENSAKSLNAYFKKNASFGKTPVTKEPDINAINSSIIAQNEERVIPYLRKKFPDFMFDEIGMMTDNIRVIAPNGKKIELPLDNWTDDDNLNVSIELKEFIRQNHDAKEKYLTEEYEKATEKYRFAQPGDKEYVKDSPYGQRKVLIDPLEKLGLVNVEKEKKIKETRAELVQFKADRLSDIYVRQKEAAKTGTKIDDKEVSAALSALKPNKATVKMTNDYFTDIDKSKKLITKENEDLKTFAQSIVDKLESGEITQEEVDNIYKPQIEQRSNALNERINLYDSQTKDLYTVNKGMQDSLAENYIIQESKGTVGGGIARGFVEGLISLPRLILSMSEKNKNDIVEDIVGVGTTGEYMSSEDRSVITKALFSLSESIGALAGGAAFGGGAVTTASFFAQGYNDMKDELNTIEGMSDTKKVLMSSSYGVLSGLLEKFGVQYSMGKSTALKGVSNTIKNSIMKTAFQSLPKDATKEMIENAIKNSITKQLTSGAIKIVGGAVVEGTTESLQAVGKIGIKEVYDLFQEKSYFDNESAWEITKDVIYEGAMGSLAGGLMSTISSVPSAIDKGFTTSYNKEQINALINLSEMENSSDQIKAMLKTNIASGKISAEDASQIAKSFDMLTSKLKELPEDLTDDNKAKSLDLIIEKDKIERQISGKDKALVTAKTDRINAINEELKAISINNSKTQQDAVKESTEQQQEVPTEGSTVEYQGANEGQQEVGQGEGSERTTTQPEANISDSNIASEEEIINKEWDDAHKEFERTDEDSILLAEGYDPKDKKAAQVHDEAYKRVREKLDKINAEYSAKLDDLKTKQTEAQVIPEKVTTEVSGKTNVKKTKVFHGANEDFTIEGKKNRIMFTSKDEDYANYYAKQSYGKVFEFDVDDSKIAKEEYVKDKIKSLDLKTENGEDIEIEDNLHRLIDPRFEDTAISKDGLDKLFSELENEGYYGVDFMDENQDLGGLNEVESIAIFNPKELLKKESSQQNEPISVAEQPTLAEVRNLDVSDKTNLQKVQSFLDNALNDLDSFGKETLGMNLPVAVARVVLKTVKTLVDAGVSLEQAFKQAAETHNVQEVDIADTLTAISNRKKETEASKAAKNISKKEKTKVTVDEYTALRDQIKLEARAAKDVKAKQAEMIKAINTSSKTGKISAAKAKALINRIQKVKLESDKSINEFLNYVERIFKDAEYGDKLSKSQSLRAKIRKGIKREGVQAPVVGTLKAFSKIDPKKVENIDEYKAFAEQLVEASKTTRVSKDGKPNFKVPAFLADINKYAASEMQRQNDLDKQELLDKYDDLVENKSISGNMSLKDIQKYVATLETKDEQIDSQKEANTRDYTQKEFDRLTEIINEELSNEESDISIVDKKRLRDILKIDLNKLSTKDAFQVVEHLNNFITNGITSNLDNIQATYDGAINAENLEKSGVKSFDIKLIFSSKIGRFFGKQTMSLPTFMDNIFGGEKRSLAVAKAMGLTNLMNSKAKAVVRHRNKMAQHKAQFEKKRPNGKNFNASENIQERGIFAYLLRNSLDGDTTMFKNRVSNTLITIDKLLNSKDKNEVKKGELLNTVADKLGLRDENVTIESVTANVDPLNQQDVNWWINTWSEIYDELSDVSLAVYNIELSPDAFYTTDSVADIDRTDLLLSDDNLSGLARNLSTSPDDKRTGVLKENNRHKVTAEGSTMINFNFDANQDRAFRAALVDLYTAKDIRQIKSFLKSKSFKNIMSSKSDAELLTLKVVNSIKRSKGKSLEEADQIAKDAEKFANRAGVLGTSMVLGRPTQWILQTIPVLGNTLINTGNLNVRNMFDRAAAEFIANSGRGISLRGKEAVSMIESTEKYLDKDPDSMIGKSMELFDWWNNKQLELFLVGADTFTANASWLAYYEQSLRKQGVHPGGKIDWKKHKQNEEAADYAQHKIDRQQNISDPDFGGELFTSKNPYVRMSTKMIMPFSNFIMNQKSRMYADLKAIRKGDNDEKRSAMASLGGLGVEALIYRGLSGLIGYGLWAWANGGASDEEKKKKVDRSINNGISSVITDIFSLAPSVNSKTIQAFNYLASTQGFFKSDEVNKLVDDENKKREEDRKPKMGEAEEEEFRRLALEEMVFGIEEYSAKDDGLGIFGIALDKGGDLVDLIKKKALGKYMDENPVTGDKSTKYLVEKDQENMTTPLLLQSLHMLRLLPQEISQYSGYLDRKISQNSLTPKQFDRYNEMKKKMNIDTDKQYVMDIVKSTANIEKSLYVLKYIEENGGFTDKEYAEYSVLKKEYGTKALGFIEELKSGKTAKQIMGK